MTTNEKTRYLKLTDDSSKPKKGPCGQLSLLSERY